MKKNSLPNYAKLTNELVASTPIQFENSLYFNFIIKGNMSKLQKICDQWFNKPSKFKKSICSCDALCHGHLCLLS